MSAPATSDFAGRDWPQWTEPTVVDVAGTPTAYRRQGSGETLVYLHGTESTRAWTPIHAELARHFDVVAPEHPGYGDTPRDPQWDRWEDWILHYDAFLRRTGLERVHLVGNSLGAWLAANLALYYPERFASLTLVAPFGVRMDPTDDDVDPFRPLDLTGLSDLLNGRGEEHAAELVQQGEFEDGLQRFAEGATTAVLMWNPRYDIKLDSRLGRITAPTAVLAPQEDRIAGDAAARFAELIPGAQLTVVPGPDGRPSSHGLVIEQPGTVAEAIASHIHAHVNGGA